MLVIYIHSGNCNFAFGEEDLNSFVDSKEEARWEPFVERYHVSELLLVHCHFMQQLVQFDSQNALSTKEDFHCTYKILELGSHRSVVLGNNDFLFHRCLDFLHRLFLPVLVNQVAGDVILLFRVGKRRLLEECKDGKVAW